ncbi:MAG TPA: SurA N-terminal domain-containing protein [Rhabdochlamydiaceae bacterium]|jgi:GcvH upstream region-like protein|nr:SurA N-terminal domain-containing protein [Rhabdochlamydiaceae bacterium]
MMNFLRKHQKKTLMIVTVMIIASFTFFGTSATLNSRDISDKKVAEALDGSPIMQRELEAMVRFLTMGSHEMLKNDLMSTGLTTILAERYFETVKGDFEEKLDKARRYAPYAHPQAPFLSAEQAWNMYGSEIPRLLEELKKGDVSPKTFAAYCNLYMSQVEFPPELLRRVLLMQQQQFKWISPDDNLYNPKHLALFGYESFEEWFGSRFTEVLGRFLFNAAAIAEKKGYKVSIDESRADLLQTALQTVRSSKLKATFAEAGEFLRFQMQMAGIDESQAVKVWRKVMLVHRLFNEVGQSVFVDPLSYRQFAAFAEESATVEVYQLPNVLRLGDFRSLLKLQYYLEAVSPKAKKLADLPRQFLSPEEVEKKVPELVISRYELDVAKVTKEEIGSRLTLKETWDFEASDAGWQKLTTEYPILSKTQGATREERYAALEAVDPNMRLKIDRFARSCLINQHPEWIEEALLKASSQKQKVALRSRGHAAPFDDIEDTAKLRAYLEKAKVGEPGPFFSQNGQTYYRIVVWNKPAAKEVMTFQEALENDWLGQLLDEKLQTAYADVRKMDPESFKLPNGSWKAYSDVRDRVGALVYADVLNQISDEELILERYPGRRFAIWMQNARKTIKEKGNESPFLKTTGQPLVDQWALVQQTKEIKRSDSTSLPKTEMFNVTEGKWSKVSIPQNGDVAFYRLIKKGVAEAAIQEKVIEGQKLLGMDAKRVLMHQILLQMDDYGSR